MHIFNPSDINTLSSELEKAEKVAIVTHFKPDGDAMGSSLAMHCFIKHFFKCEVKIILNDRYPQSIAFMVDTEAGQDILTYDENPDEIIQTIAAADHIVALDFNAFHRTDRLETLLKESEAFKILIDHHLHPDTESFNLVFSYQSISSASELVYHILKATPQCQGKKRINPILCSRVSDDRNDD